MFNKPGAEIRQSASRGSLGHPSANGRCAPCSGDNAGLGLLAEYFRDGENPGVTDAQDLLQFLHDNGATIEVLRHPQEAVTYDAWSARVDTEIVSIITALWRQGIPTRSSCQGGDWEPAHIVLPSTGSGRATLAQLLHYRLIGTVPTLTWDRTGRRSRLSWDPADSGSLQDALTTLTWSRGLAWNTQQDSVQDFYGWR